MYWLGGHGAVDARRKALERGVTAGQAAAKLQPNRPEGHFWAAANMGALGRVGWHELFAANSETALAFYSDLFGWKHADFAPFSINAHANAMHNPFARLHQKLNADQFERSSMISTPINLMDASPIGDGAAAVVIVPAEQVASLKGMPRITVAGSASATDTLAVHSRKDPLFLSAAYESSKRAYEMANIEVKDIDVFELHDAFSIMSALSLEACGFAERGQGVRLGLDNEIGPNGRLPICTRGGLKARGHPVGATGMYQIVEVVQQLRGECNGTQVDGAKIGMAQNIGGSGATIITHILKAE